MKALRPFVIFLLLAGLSSGQEAPSPSERYNGADFRAPLDIPLRLAGSFGELRSNHFHSGVDFKTQGRKGVPLKAIEKGYVARIKVSASGFGKALYVNHPNGYTSVYAHIDRFHESIEQFVKKVQYEKESWEIQLYPNRNKFNFDKGDVIAYSGNSGSSKGPHLHFEIRDTQSEEPINPLFFDFGVQDTRHPRIRGIQLYPKGKNAVVKANFSYKEDITSREGPVEMPVREVNGRYRLDGIEELQATGKIGIGVETYDYHNGSGNPLGIYRMTLRDDEKLLFKSTIDRFPFYKTRYINAHLDYGTRVKSGAKYQRCFVLPGNRLSFYETIDKGFFRVTENQVPSLSLTLEDTHGNKSLLEIEEMKHLAKSSTKASNEEGEKHFPHNQVNEFEKAGIRLKFPANSFYDTVCFQFDVEKAKDPEIKSSVYQIHNPYTPVHKYYDIAMKASDVSEPLKGKALIVYRDEEGEEEAEGGEWENGYIETKARLLGEFYLKVDTVNPEIEPQNIWDGKQLSDGDEIRVEITDSLAGIGSYRAEIDGDWARMAYDEKNDLLIYRDIGDLESGKHELEITVKDEKSNQAIYHVQFVKD